MKNTTLIIFGIILGLGITAGVVVRAAAPITPIEGGGTGTSTIPAYGQVLVGNHLNGYDLVATSSLGISGGGGGSGSVTSVGTNNGLTGGTITTTGTIGLDITGLSTNAITAWDGSKLVATGTPRLTVGYITATTTATSTYGGGINLATGCFAINNTCIGSGGGSGTVTSIATTWPIIGGTITNTGTLTFGGLSTSSPAVIGNIPYFSGVNTFANVATTTASCSGSTSCSSFIVIVYVSIESNSTTTASNIRIPYTK